MDQEAQKIIKGKQIGIVTHYFDKIGVAVVKADETLRVGDAIVIEGHGKEFEQSVETLEVDRKPVDKIGKGEEAGMKVAMPVKQGCKVYLRG